MSGILAPIKQVLIDIKLNNPLDTATYYVRAVIKNSLSGETLDTLNLTDNGNKYFSSTWTTPNDPSGNGLQIVVFKTVYDDAGYTTESPVYGTTIENYVIRDLAGSNVFGGGWSGLSKKDIQEVIRKELPDLLNSIPSVDYTKIHTEIYTEIQKSEDNIFSRVVEKVTEKIKQKVEQMFVPSEEVFTLQKEATKTFLTEAKNTLQGIIREHTKMKHEEMNLLKEQEKEHEQIKKGVEYFQKQLLEKLLEINTTLEKLQKITHNAELQKKEEDTKILEDIKESQKKRKAEKFMQYAFNALLPKAEGEITKKGAERFIQYVNN